MPRYKLLIEYDGAPFWGWQYQDKGPSVQGALEDAVKAMTGQSVRVNGAGRTDAGVHALGQVAHIDLTKDYRADRVRDALNAHLRPHPIGVLSAEIVPDTFDARFSATKRHYIYRIVNHRANLALKAGQAWRVPRPLDAKAMHDAAQVLLGKHDFTTFRDTECQAKSPEKTLDTIDVMRDGDEVNITTSRAHFCTARCVRWSALWFGSVMDAGQHRICATHLRRVTARPAARSRRRTGSIWCG
jgi:tRNA pseudouridine38-40 synthase